MAKKGGVQQLQADIGTDEEFEKFLERPGLLVMDVYTEWCGPCLGMVGSLKKIKLEIGGDNLQLAICKSDTIKLLKRFRNKSEPTWLFASSGKAVNIMFGTNVPKLMKLIIDELETELKYQEGTVQRKFYGIEELQPIEVERLNVKLAEEYEATRIEKEAALEKRRTYLMYVTDEIMQNMSDHAVTIFGPHINRDMFKKILDPAEVYLLQCKDRKYLTVQPENLEILQFECPNPLPDDVWKYIFKKEILVCLWKKADNDDRDVEVTLNEFIENLTTPQSLNDEFSEFSTDALLPPVVQNLEVILSPASLEGDINEKKKSSLMIKDKEKEKNEEIMKEEIKLDIAIEGGDDEMKNIDEENLIEHEEVSEKKTKSVEESINITVPGVWAPGNKRGHAAAIYLFFRSHTAQFLPPDPEPEPPHLVVAFDAYKRKNIQDVCERFKDAILLYGYFTSTDPDKAELIANSSEKYDMKPQNVTDKLVLKVAKKTSHPLLALSAHGPAYVSPNTVVGAQQCKKFFPEGYKTGEMEEVELKAQDSKNAEKKKKRKKKKGEESGEQVGTAIAQEISESKEQAGDEDEGVAEDDHVEEGDDVEGEAGGDAEGGDLDGGGEEEGLTEENKNNENN